MFAGHDAKGVRVYDLKETPKTHSLSQFFRLGEFVCHDGSDIVLIHSELLALLEHLRTYYGKAIKINSAYRTVSHNAKIGGKADSRHVRGMAADIVISGVTPAALAKYCAEIGVGGIGVYPTFVHVDVWGVGRRWKG